MKFDCIYKATKLFNMKWVFSIFFIALASSGFILDKSISGTVVDENGSPLLGATIRIPGTQIGVISDINGQFTISVPDEMEVTEIEVSYIGFATQKVTIKNGNGLQITMIADTSMLEDVVVTTYGLEKKLEGRVAGLSIANSPGATVRIRGVNSLSPYPSESTSHNTEDYSAIEENIFKRVSDAPLTTFSVDVDRAAYSNIRRILSNGSLPPANAVRIEEMINYFNYSYKQPKGNRPVAVESVVFDSPWNKDLKLVHIGLQAKKVNIDNLPPSNLVFLLDVSGSMDSPNKLGLVKASMNLLVDQLREEDKIAIVVYAGAAGVVLEPTSDKTAIREALNKLRAGGSTAGGQGIKLAYKIAEQNFLQKGNNRVILATDGDFNVGVSSDAGMQELIEKKRESGVFLSVLGFGMGNYKDNKMEILADKGNGNYAYIDNVMEANKVFVNEFGGTLFTVAKDVKLQVEFNPTTVEAYRLIGYENRALNNEDFNDDKKDAGDMGSGHTVTALYEIVPKGVKSDYLKSIDALKYQKTKTSSNGGDEYMTVKIRYKIPDSDISKKMEFVIKEDYKRAGYDVQFAAAVAQFGLLLRDSDFKGSASYNNVIDLANEGKGKDEEGYRAEFIKLVKSAQLLDNRNTSDNVSR